MWRDDDHALFRQLKLRAAALMEQIAARCDERYAALCREAAGPALVDRFVEPVQLFPVAGRNVRRQDSELVKHPPHHTTDPPTHRPTTTGSFKLTLAPAAGWASAEPNSSRRAAP
jgi:hypothetical protein